MAQGSQDCACEPARDLESVLGLGSWRPGQGAWGLAEAGPWDWERTLGLGAGPMAGPGAGPGPRELDAGPGTLGLGQGLAAGTGAGPGTGPKCWAQLWAKD